MPLPETVVEAIQTPGEPLDAQTRQFMEPRFGQSFGDVQVHADAQAADSALSMNAGAYAVGKHIVFGPGLYSPETVGGKAVLAHELAHVIQQAWTSGGRNGSGVTHEDEANRAAAEIGVLGMPMQVQQAAGLGLACMSIAEARRALWGHVPDSVKEYVQPIAEKAAAAMDKVVPPDTQLPKPVEAVVEHVEHPVETLKAVVSAPVKAAKASLQGKGDTSGKGQQASIAQLAKQKVKEKVRDYALENVGETKGIALEAGNIVDTLAWLPYAGHELAESAIGKGPVADKLLLAADLVSGYAMIQSATELTGWSEVDPITGKPTGALSVSGAIGRGFDYGAEKIESAAGLPKEDALLFSSYEKGELTGSIGSQVALAFVGVEEVQLALKAIGAIGAAKSIVESVQHKGKDFYRDPQFWTGLLTAALSVLGLSKTRAAQKIIKIVLAGGGVVNAVPAVWQLYNDYNDQSLAQADREKKIKGDISQIIKVLSNAVLEIVRKRGSVNQAGVEEPGAKPVTTEGEAKGGTTAKPSTTEGEPLTTAKPTVTEGGTGGGTGGVSTGAHPATTEPPVATAKPTAKKAPAATKKAPGAGGTAKKAASKAAPSAKKTRQREATATPQTPSGLELDTGPRQTVPSTHGEIDLGPQTPSGLELDPAAKPTRPSTYGERDLGPQTPSGLELDPAAKPTRPSTYGERDLGPQTPSGLELDPAAKPTRPSTYGERDLGPQTPSGLELDPAARPARPSTYGERDLGPSTGKDLKVYTGKKPVDRIPGVKKVKPTFGEASTEKGGTLARSGMSYREFNAAEMTQGLRIDYDPVAGRPRSVSYRVDASAASTSQVAERAFTKDVSVKGAQSKDSAYADSKYDKGHLAQREAFAGYGDAETAADQFTNVVPMKPELNRGAGSPWRAAEADTIRWAKKYGSVTVKVEPIYDASPTEHLRDGTPVPKAIRRTVIAPDGMVLQDVSFLNR
jgi:DNA/RNA endonuclease G (NUC1)